MNSKAPYRCQVVCLEVVRILHIHTDSPDSKPELILVFLHFDLFGVYVDGRGGSVGAVGGDRTRAPRDVSWFRFIDMRTSP